MSGPNAAAPIFAIEVSTMAEREPTGISNVTRNLVREALGDASVEPAFFMNRQRLPTAIMPKLLDGGGDILWWIAGRVPDQPWESSVLDRDVIGLFPWYKWHRRFFPFEISFVHDLTPILAPQFHLEHTVAEMHEKLFGDLMSSDLLAAPSASTIADVRAYFPELAAVPSVVAPLAPCSRPVARLAAPDAVEPYVVVLGTLEPRKNVRFVLEHLAANQDLLGRLVFVFVGRMGWGDEMSELVATLGLEEQVARGRIRFTGFVADAVRDRLLAHAVTVVYPSLYEGFGLPVVEALSFGVPVITTWSSSLPEAGGDVAVYFDPNRVGTFAEALDRVLRDERDPELRASGAERRRAWAASMTWKRTYETIRDAAFGVLAARRRQAA
ncbi:MAG: glycosyltransferase family 4 protein [Acetobacteraceae bacterium]|nr:glycosyltransferase family 4 protein [Acetobacteraceae bacterium]